MCAPILGLRLLFKKQFFKLYICRVPPGESPGGCHSLGTISSMRVLEIPIKTCICRSLTRGHRIPVYPTGREISQCPTWISLRHMSN